MASAPGWVLTEFQWIPSHLLQSSTQPILNETTLYELDGTPPKRTGLRDPGVAGSSPVSPRDAHQSPRLRPDAAALRKRLWQSSAYFLRRNSHRESPRGHRSCNRESG